MDLEFSNSSETVLNTSLSAHGPDLLFSLLVPCHPRGIHRFPFAVAAAPGTLRGISVMDKPTVSLQVLPLLQWSCLAGVLRGEKMPS